MLATASEPFSDADYAWEAKLDGFRCVAFVEEGRVRLQNRRQRDITAQFPEVVAALRHSVAAPCVVDGEIVALAAGVPSFQRLMLRGVEDPARAARLAREVPATYYAFDCLEREGRDLRPAPLEARRRELAAAVSGPAVPLSPWLAGEGEEIFRRAVAAGFEGAVAKRRGSPYVEGRSAHWRKVKRVGTVDAVVGGWTAGEGGRAGTLGSLLVGLWEPAGLRYIGSVGTGFTDSDLLAFTDALRRLARADSPFRDPPSRPARWVDPVLVVEVGYHEFTRDGRLRAPRYRRLRPDKPPAACTVAGELAAG